MDFQNDTSIIRFTIFNECVDKLLQPFGSRSWIFADGKDTTYVHFCTCSRERPMIVKINDQELGQCLVIF